MKLVAEQVKLLRKKREELLKSKREYSKYLSESRERDSIDGTTPFYADYLEGQNYQRTMKELHRIEDILSSAELVIDRNFDSIEVGTAFYAQFDGDDEKERITLVESDASMGHDFPLVSLGFLYLNLILLSLGHLNLHFIKHFELLWTWRNYSFH